MKFGVRKPSVKKSISARTKGKAKRKLKKIANPLYGKKGIGWIKNPKRAFKNKIYRKTTISVSSIGGCLWACIFYPCYWIVILCWWILKCFFIVLWILCVAMINGIITIINLLTKRKLSDEETDDHTIDDN